MQELPGVPDAVISNAALGSATVEQYEPNPHKQDLAMLQVPTSSSLYACPCSGCITTLPRVDATGLQSMQLILSGLNFRTSQGFLQQYLL